jgi:hypothetical protein
MKYTRHCAACDKELYYTNKYNRNRAEKENKICRTCAFARRDYNGQNNPFYGKHHSVETKQAIANNDRSYATTKEFKEKMSKVTTGSNNPMYGVSVYETWVKKYGKDEADQRQLTWKAKLSERSRGLNNPMFGRCSPQGSGNGWCGWYKKWHFRSLRELAYVIKVIEPNNWIWKSAERKDLAIPYITPLGENRTYYADFLINDSLLVEVKPSKLNLSPTVQAKQSAALLFCATKGWQYSIVDANRLSDEEVRRLHDAGDICFIDRYETMFEARYAQTL